MPIFSEVVNEEQILRVERLAREIWVEHYTPIVGLPQVEYMLSKFQCAAAIRQAIKDGCQYFLVLRDDREAGYLAVHPRIAQKELYLSKLYLLSSCRGQGLGRDMIDFVRAFARKAGLKKIVLHTNKANIETIRFYEKAGFRNKGSDTRDLGEGFVGCDWLMEMAI